MQTCSPKVKGKPKMTRQSDILSDNMKLTNKDICTLGLHLRTCLNYLVMVMGGIRNFSRSTPVGCSPSQILTSFSTPFVSYHNITYLGENTNNIEHITKLKAIPYTNSHTHIPTQWFILKLLTIINVKILHKLSNHEDYNTHS